MFLKKLTPYKKLHPSKYNFLKKRISINLGVCAWITAMLFMLVIIMSLMIVKASSTAAFYQNRTTALRTRSIKSFNPRNIRTTNATTTTRRTTTTTTTSTTTAATTSSAATSTEAGHHPLQKDSPTTKRPQTEGQQKAEALKSVKFKKIMHKKSLRAGSQQQQQQQPMLQPQERQPPLQELHAMPDENAYLLERAADNTNAAAHEQPIYGTWRTKARRPPPPLVAAAPAAAAQVATTTAFTLSGMDDAKSHDDELDADSVAHHPLSHQHLYEQLPKRSSTMTPLKSELHDQIPRPPRLTSRRPSIVLRRQYLETPLNVSMRDEKPRPFHFPYEGPLPEEFKKAEPERDEVNNIQDILQQLNLNNGRSKLPPMVMMPTGLHIAGSFKNLKSSGITNFFRNKRNKKQMQLTLPVPVQLFGGYHPHLYGGMMQPYQRISMDHIYPFKARSPNDINLLAMHEQLKATRAHNKKKQKAIANTNLLLQHSQQRPFVADPYWQAYPQFFSLNATQKPKLKRVPFKVNLDIFPVLPPTKDYKASPFTLEEARIPPTSRAPSVLRNPFTEYYPFPFAPSAAGLNYAGQYEHPVLNRIKFPTASAQTAAQIPQSSNMQISFPDQLPKYVQQQQQQLQQEQQQQLQQQQKQQQQLQQQQKQQQQQQQLQQQQQQQLQQHHLQQQQQLAQQPPPQHHFIPSPSSNQHSSFIPIDCELPPPMPTNSNAKSNQIMVHLNVFPKQKSATTFSPPTNPFYSSSGGINQRSNTINEASSEDPLAVEPRSNHKNVSSSNALGPIARSDNFDPPAEFDGPNMAAESTNFRRASALVSNKLDSSDLSPHYDVIEARNNFPYNGNAHVDQLASEAQAASLFRFPVEDLIQFHVDDAL